MEVAGRERCIENTHAHRAFSVLYDGPAYPQRLSIILVFFSLRILTALLCDLREHSYEFSNIVLLLLFSWILLYTTKEKEEDVGEKGGSQGQATVRRERENKLKRRNTSLGSKRGKQKCIKGKRGKARGQHKQNTNTKKEQRESERIK